MLSKNDWLDRNMGDVVALMVYVGHGDSLLTRAWPHTPVFTDVIEKWIETVGTHDFAYSCLITMLEGPGWNLIPEPALSWLSRIVSTSVDLPALWKKNDNGLRTAELLQRMYDDPEVHLRNDRSALELFSRLVDRLVAAGISLALDVVRHEGKFMGQRDRGNHRIRDRQRRAFSPIVSLE